MLAETVAKFQQIVEKSQKYGLVQRKQCEARKKLKNEALNAKIGVDTAENELWKGSEKAGTLNDPVGDTCSPGALCRKFRLPRQGADGCRARWRPDLLHLPTTCCEQTTGDGIKMGQAIGAQLRLD